MPVRSVLLIGLVLGGCRGKSATDSTAWNGNTSDSGSETGPTSPSTTALTTASGCGELSDRPVLSGSLCVEEAPCTWTGGQAYEVFGYSVASGEDLDGDGRDDFVVGAPMSDVDLDKTSARLDAGAVYIISGVGIDSEAGGVIGVFPGENLADYAGSSVSMLGDATGDGLSDLLVGSRGHDGGGTDAGAVYLISGSSETWSGEVVAEASWLGERDHARAGTAVAGAGDVNGDGLADLLLSGELKEYNKDSGNETKSSGRAYLVFGQDGGWQSNGSLADADASFDGEQVGQAAGAALSNGGDLDGDGYADPVVSATYGGSYTGRVYVIPGDASALSGAQSLSTAPIQIDGESSYDVFGWALSMGDLNGDGIDDLAIGAPGEDFSRLSGGGIENEGRVHVVYGSATGVGLGVLPECVLRQSALGGGSAINVDLPGVSETGDLLGYSLACGDVNGDGFDDLTIGAPGESYGAVPRTGTVQLIFGSSAPFSNADPSTGRFSSVAADNLLSRSVHVSDLDADGFAELIVGTPGFDTPTTQDVGRVLVYMANSGGIPGTPLVIGPGDLLAKTTDDENGDGSITMTDLVLARMGESLTSGRTGGGTRNYLYLGAPGFGDSNRIGSGAVLEVLDPENPFMGKLLQQDTSSAFSNLPGTAGRFDLTGRPSPAETSTATASTTSQSVLREKA